MFGTLASRPSARSIESLALGVGVTAFVFVAVVAIFVFRFEPAPISGPGSVGEYAAVASGVATALAVLGARYVVRERTRAGRIGFFDVVDVVALAFALAVIVILTLTLLAGIMEQSFQGATVFGFSVLVLSGATAAIAAYFTFYLAAEMTLSSLAAVLAVFLVEGVITSALTASDPQWWKENLSALGMNNDFSSWAFNISLIVSGILVTALARLATRGVPTTNPEGVQRTRVALVVIGIFLACVGVFPVDEFLAIHNTVATGMAVVFAITVFRVHSWIPGLARAFRLVGYLFVAVVVVAGVFFAVGFYTLTAVELIAGALVFSWIILLVRNCAALVADSTRNGGDAEAPAPAVNWNP
ncbi:hypothetical protein LK09_01660 [Microbacterium mangrovi]|uniref:DUF998 domain-containing protein n=1 Tax=Microbacterium mangrovi TaxID=1348253 RepID=A0A0B2AEC0_9MICO|nr:hypothetical protein LK09_01660 [Microbacterium mangrovi]